MSNVLLPPRRVDIWFRWTNERAHAELETSASTEPQQNHNFFSPALLKPLDVQITADPYSTGCVGPDKRRRLKLVSLNSSR